MAHERRVPCEEWRQQVRERRPKLRRRKELKLVAQERHNEMSACAIVDDIKATYQGEVVALLASARCP